MISVQNENIAVCKLLIENGALSSINTPNNVYLIISNVQYIHICKTDKMLLCLLMFLMVHIREDTQF
jgi:hypothetical protein